MDVYPTAPFGSQAQQSHGDTPTSPAESSGNSNSVLSKVKHKARKFKNKIKKVTGSSPVSSPSPAVHGDHVDHDRRAYNDALRHDGEEVDDGAESDEDGEEDDDISKQNDKQFNKYEQLRSIGVLDKQGDGSEVEIHGGVPVSAPTNPGTYWGSAGDSAPISPYKSAGPPDALQATPTEYRNYAADDDHLVASGEEKSTSSTPRLQGDAISRDLDDSLGVPSLPEGDTSKLSPHHESAGIYPIHGTSDGLQGDAISADLDGERSPVAKPTWPESDTSKSSPHHVPAQFHSRQATSDTPSTSVVDSPYPENLVNPNTSSENLERPTHDNIPVSDDRSADGKLGSGTFDKDLVKPNTIGNSQFPTDNDNNAVANEDPFAERKLGLGTSDTPLHPDVDAHYSDNLVKPNSSFGNSELPIHDKTPMTNEDLSPDGKLGLGASNTPSASTSDVDVPYPEDLVKPNPSFGKSESPTHDKIAVMNEDLSADRKLGLGLASSDNHSGSGKGDLLQTSVPEFSELSGYQDSPSGPAERDNLVYRPITDPAAKLSITSDLPGKVDRDDGVALTKDSGTGLYPDNRESQVQGEKDVDPRSVVEEEDDISPVGVYSNEAQYASPYGSGTQVSDTARDGGQAWTQQFGRGGKNAVDEEAGISSAGTYSSEAQHARPHGSGETPVSDAAREGAPAVSGLLAVGEIATASDSDYERWGNLSADKTSNVNYGNTGLTGAELADESKPRQSSPIGWESKLQDDVKTADDTDKVEILQNDDRGAEPGSHENVEEDAEEEFYDPNEVKDNQFEEGFAHGAVEEDILSGTLAGSAIGKLQGLRDTVTTSLGYPKQDDKDVAGGEERSVLEEEESALSPSKQQPRAGFVQGLRETVASSLGYGNASPRSALNSNSVSERGEVPEVDAAGDRQQQPQGGGTLQGLKNVVTSRLGYGLVQEESPKITKESEPPQIPAAGTTSNDSVYDEEENRGNVSERGEESEVGAAGDGHQQPQGGGSFQGLKNVVASKLGYGVMSEESPTLTKGSEPSQIPAAGAASDGPVYDEEENRSGEEYEVDAVGDRQQQPQGGGTLQGLENVATSKLGYGVVPEESAAFTKGIEPLQIPAAGAVSNEPVYDKEENRVNAPTRGEEFEVDAAGDRQQQQPQGGGTLQGLKNVAASKLGYGALPEESPALAKGSEPQIHAAEAASNEPVYDEEENHANVGHVSSDAKLHAADQQRGGGMLEGMKGLLSSRFGYSKQPEESIMKSSPTKSASESASVPSDSSEQQSTYTQKLFNTTAAARDYLSSKVGGGGMNGEEQQRNHAYESDGKASHLDTNDDGQYDTASKLFPSEDDKALSELITDSLSNTANTVGEKLGLFGGKQSPRGKSSQIEH